MGDEDFHAYQEFSALDHSHRRVSTGDEAMRTTNKQDAQFIAAMVPNDWLETCADWIASEFSPEDVFGKDAMEEWAKENGYIKEL